MDVARQAPLTLGFPRQEYWSGLPFTSPGDLPNPGIKLESPALAGVFFSTEPPTQLNEYSGEILEYILSSTELRTLTYKWVEISTI